MRCPWLSCSQDGRRWESCDASGRRLNYSTRLMNSRRIARNKAMVKGVDAMRRFIEVVVVGSVLIFSAGAQESGQPVLRKGVSVQMAAAEHAVAMPAADK